MKKRTILFSLLAVAVLAVTFAFTNMRVDDPAGWYEYNPANGSVTNRAAYSASPNLSYNPTCNSAPVSYQLKAVYLPAPTNFAAALSSSTSNVRQAIAQSQANQTTSAACVTSSSSFGGVLVDAEY